MIKMMKRYDPELKGGAENESRYNTTVLCYGISKR